MLKNKINVQKNLKKSQILLQFPVLRPECHINLFLLTSAMILNADRKIKKISKCIQRE